jgi:hypothetical protein
MADSCLGSGMNPSFASHQVDLLKLGRLRGIRVRHAN